MITMTSVLRVWTVIGWFYLIVILVSVGPLDFTNLSIWSFCTVIPLFTFNYQWNTGNNEQSKLLDSCDMDLEKYLTVRVEKYSAQISLPRSFPVEINTGDKVTFLWSPFPFVSQQDSVGIMRF